MSETQAVALPINAIREYCASQPIQRLSLFGSALHGDLRKDSDIDLLVEYLPEASVSLFAMVGQERRLTEIIGVTVDLRTPNELSHYFRQQVLDGARLLYAKAV